MSHPLNRLARPGTPERGPGPCALDFSPGLHTLPRPATSSTASPFSKLAHSLFSHSIWWPLLTLANLPCCAATNTQGTISHCNHLQALTLHPSSLLQAPSESSKTLHHPSLVVAGCGADAKCTDDRTGVARVAQHHSQACLATIPFYQVSLASSQARHLGI